MPVVRFYKSDSSGLRELDCLSTHLLKYCHFSYQLGNCVVYKISIPIRGGKGGFGRNLKKEKSLKKTTNFDACRDLSGRRVGRGPDISIAKSSSSLSEQFAPAAENRPVMDVRTTESDSFAGQVQSAIEIVNEAARIGAESVYLALKFQQRRPEISAV